jgi:Protein of unknown function (DUF3187)
MLRGAVTACAVLAALPAGASQPLYVKNISPVSGLLGLPAQRQAQTASVGSMHWNLHGSLASHYVLEESGNEWGTFDGETLRFAAQLQYSPFESWDLQLEIPWLQHSGGFLDSPIESFHDLFDLPDGGRAQVDKDLLNYHYIRDFGSVIALDDSAAGVGDVSLSLNHVFYRKQRLQAGLGLGYKFASGDEDQLLGSGAEDVFATLRLSGVQPFEKPLSWHAQLGYLRAGSMDYLRDIARRDLWYLGFSLDWALWQSVSLLAQLDLHGAPARSELAVLGDEAIMLSLGARWLINPNWSLDLGFVEDARVETAPDIIFQASLRYRPGSL